jgi:hypothetical protein
METLRRTTVLSSQKREESAERTYHYDISNVRMVVKGTLPVTSSRCYSESNSPTNLLGGGLLQIFYENNNGPH